MNETTTTLADRLRLALAAREFGARIREGKPKSFREGLR